MAYSGDADLTLGSYRVLPVISGETEIEQAPSLPAISSPNSEAKDKEKRSDISRLVHTLPNAYIAFRELGYRPKC